ncbi:protein delta homolog 1 [Erpetoichthys calabaricus]|uniref:Protein delta homolog 1 n=1 Tax=Erpetoichthys calabaricus TaxID=27687 RepID=A0A8C4T8Y7_ERPCA|nr:protein delta homolog 1 [Erpetoichthys calabaricus]
MDFATLCFLMLLSALRGTQGIQCASKCDPERALCGEDGECRCKPGWRGAHCNQCVPFSGCVHGNCTKPWQCQCEPGWTGSRCDVGARPCASTPCINNSTCTETGDGGFLCICEPGYVGNNCHLKTGPCYINGSPCQNGGTCFDDNGLAPRSSCTCPQGFIGDFCEIDSDDCESNPCKNGGTCLDSGSDYTCLCQANYTGKDCNESLTPCARERCENGGTCSEESGGGFLCLCRPGFYGKTCGSREVRSSAQMGRGTPHYSLPSHVFHKMLHQRERGLLKITLKQAIRSSDPDLSRSQVICFAVLGILTCLVVIGTTGIVFFTKCEMWLANAKYKQLVHKHRSEYLKTNDGNEQSVHIVLPDKINMAGYTPI